MAGSSKPQQAGVSARAGAALERRAHTSGTGPPWSEPQQIQDEETNYGMIGVRAVMLLIPCVQFRSMHSLHSRYMCRVVLFERDGRCTRHAGST